MLISISGYSQVYNTQVEAKIELKSNNNLIEITGFAFNKTEIDQSLRYVLSVIKKTHKIQINQKMINLED